MQHGKVDLCIVGTDRTTATGDVANKIGTYLKALAAKDNGVPFYVALPSPTIDWTISDGVRDIPIEEREESEVTRLTGKTAAGEEIGRQSGRERVCQYVSIWVVAVALKKKTIHTERGHKKSQKATGSSTN